MIDSVKKCRPMSPQVGYRVVAEEGEGVYCVRLLLWQMVAGGSEDSVECIGSWLVWSEPKSARLGVGHWDAAALLWRAIADFLNGGRTSDELRKLLAPALSVDLPGIAYPAQLMAVNQDIGQPQYALFDRSMVTIFSPDSFVERVPLEDYIAMLREDGNDDNYDTFAALPSVDDSGEEGGSSVEGRAD